MIITASTRVESDYRDSTAVNRHYDADDRLNHNFFINSVSAPLLREAVLLRRLGGSPCTGFPQNPSHLLFRKLCHPHRYFISSYPDKVTIPRINRPDNHPASHSLGRELPIAATLDGVIVNQGFNAQKRGGKRLPRAPRMRRFAGQTARWQHAFARGA